MKIGVVIPWRETASRLPLKNYIDNWYKQNIPNAKIIYSDTNHKVFNLSAARNAGVNQLLDQDIIVFNDADTYAEKNAMLKGIDMAYETGLAVNPFSAAKLLSLDNTKKIVNEGGDPYNVDGDIYPNSSGGIIIVTPKTLKMLGGWDEKFIGWGFEDAAFFITHLTLLDKAMLKIPDSYIYCLAHVINNREKNLVDLGKERCILYEQASGNKAEINKLITEK
jgi:predicted glycosyltransferase involved in capsule biosynthesis